MTMSPTTMPTNDNGCCATLIPTDQLPARAPDLMRELVRDFLGGRRQTTHKVYSQALEDFTRFLGVDRIDQAAEHPAFAGAWSGKSIGASVPHSPGPPRMSTATINVRLAAIRSLARLARVVGLVSWAWRFEISVRKAIATCRDREPIVDGDYWIERPSMLPAHAARDQAMLRLMFDLGLRRGSVISLDRETR